VKVPCPVCKSTRYRRPFRDITGDGFVGCLGCYHIYMDIMHKRRVGIRRPIDNAWMVVFKEAHDKWRL